MWWNARNVSSHPEKHCSPYDQAHAICPHQGLSTSSPLQGPVWRDRLRLGEYLIPSRPRSFIFFSFLLFSFYLSLSIFLSLSFSLPSLSLPFFYFFLISIYYLAPSIPSEKRRSTIPRSCRIRQVSGHVGAADRLSAGRAQGCCRELTE